MRIRAIGITSAIVILYGTMLALASGPGNRPGLTLVGNTLRDSNNIVVLHGVDPSGSEYACTYGDYFDNGVSGPTGEDVEVGFMAGWTNLNVVQIGLNEDCWLGINGLPQGYSAASYISAIQHYVAVLEAHNIYPILSLFWAASGTTAATSQPTMPDNDHTPAFWESVANTFKNDPKVIFRLQEEPKPAGNSNTVAAWTCWSKGDVQYGTSNTLVPVSTNVNCSEGFVTVGFQSLVNIVRGTGATNVIELPGVEYANDMTHFLDPGIRVNDTLATPQLIGAVDVYLDGNSCGSVSCYNSQYVPVAGVMPLHAGEIGPTTVGTATVDTLIAWLDGKGAGYNAWSWNTWGGQQALITANGTGTASTPWGMDYKAHLAAIHSPSIPDPVSISSGGAAAAPFIADAGFSGGLVTSNWSGAVDTSLVTNVTPASLSVYQTERYGTFSYTVSQLTASNAYTVNLHFTEDFETAAGQRLQNVSINGTQVLSNFDIFAATRAQHKAIMKTFTANADASGNIAISFAAASGSPDTSTKGMA